MHTLIILDHPYPGSFTHALADSARRGLELAGHSVDTIDLHADSFDPVMHLEDLGAWRAGQVVDPQVADYQQRLRHADHLVLAFPIWWEVMPAMTKGFIDKVITKGFAYTQDKPGGLMKGRLDHLNGVTLLTSMATPTILYRTVFGGPITKAVFRGTFGKLGVGNLSWHNYANVAAKTLAEREALLERTADQFARLRSPRPNRRPVAA